MERGARSVLGPSRCARACLLLQVREAKSGWAEPDSARSDSCARNSGEVGDYYGAN
jgi:hypothetical protein